MEKSINLNNKINEFESPIYDDLETEKRRLIAVQCYFETFLNNQELYELVLNSFSHDLLLNNIKWESINTGTTLLVKHKQETHHYCITKKVDNQEIEFAVFNNNVLYKINLTIKPRKKNQSKCIYTESYRYSKAFTNSDYKQEFRFLKNDIMKRALDLKNLVLQHTRNVGKKHATSN